MTRQVVLPSEPEQLHPTKRLKTMADDGNTSGQHQPMDIDEGLHSRQLAVYGKESMQMMAKSQILIIGAQGLGIEIAKNVVLAGVKGVALHDPAPATVADLGTQFFLTPEDVGRSRAEASVRRLQELNTSVDVVVAPAVMDDSYISQFNCVVCTGKPLAEALAINNVCRQKQPAIPFIRADTWGVFASVFCDFGPAFTVLDVDGEEPVTGIIASITSGQPALVTGVEDERFAFSDGDLVVFSEVEGMDALNDGVPRKVINCKPLSFQLDCDTSGMGEYRRGGMVTQVKQPKVVEFKPLQEAIAAPGEFLLTDFAKFDRPPQLHVIFQALEKYWATKGELPGPDAASDVEALASELNAARASDDPARVEQVDAAVVKALCGNTAGQLNCMTGCFGGVVGQEVMKAVSGKFHPLQQWLLFDSMETLPEGGAPGGPLDGSRYQCYNAILGPALQSDLSNLHVFLVGAGALGCEFLKNFALSGIGTGPRGKVTVTDDDVIEKSNLSRQFLFRNSDIGRSKSDVAAAAVRAMNPEIKIVAMQERVSPQTENVFGDEFWAGVDVVVNALDNVKARLYVDARCVYFGKPLLESGTLGPKCNTQMVIPDMTENYGASRDPPEKQAPMCTLHSFPHNIDHCLTWGRSEFQGLFEGSPSEAQAFLADPAKYLASLPAGGDTGARENLEKVEQVLVSEIVHSFEAAVTWARLKFQELFHNRIAQLTYTFPEDAKTATGALFWSPPKRFPTAIKFDPTDPLHVSMVQAAAILKSQLYGIQLPDYAGDLAMVGQRAAETMVPEFTPKDGVKIETDPNATAASSATQYDDGRVNELRNSVQAAAAQLPPNFQVHPTQFEKDDDTNYHMQYIASMANLRARNYGIAEVDKFKAKIIAGRIIPAIATATAVATGLVGLELPKVVAKKPLEAFRNSFGNLALPLFTMSEPIAAKVLTYRDLKWTLWDRWTLDGDMTPSELIKWFQQKGLEPYSISYGPSLLFNDIFPRHKERLNTKLSELVKTVGKANIDNGRPLFDVVVACEDEDGEDVDVPLVTIRFR